MFIVRPASALDLPAIEAMAAAGAMGVAALPTDRDTLREKIARSQRSFACAAGLTGEEDYFFVLENTETLELAGTSGILATAGFRDPFYSYRNEIIVHASQELQVSNKIHALQLCHDLTGSSLLTSFTIAPNLHDTLWPQLLSRARLLFIAAHPERFAKRIAAENPGWCDENGNAPFWDAVGRRFFGMDYRAAEQLSGGGSRTFLAELMPQYPIYVPLLPPLAKQAIGKVHSMASLPHSIQVEEGFEEGTYVDIFHGGSTTTARTSTLQSVVKSRSLQVRLLGAHDDLSAVSAYLVANTGDENFRATIADAREEGGELLLNQAAADRLNVTAGDWVRAVAR
jgi:arginine N-succinyltransferase